MKKPLNSQAPENNGSYNAEEQPKGLMIIQKSIPAPENQIIVARHTGSQTESLAVNPEYYALALCVQGTSVRTSNQFRFNINPNTLHLIAPRSLNAYHEPSEDLELYLVFFKKDLLNDILVREALLDTLLLSKNNTPPIWTVSPDRINTIRTVFQRLYSEYYGYEPYHDQMLKLLFVEVMLEISRINGHNTEKSARLATRPQQIVRHFKRLIEEHYVEYRTVQDYADKLFVTPKHLSEVIKQQTGTTPLYLIHSRLYQEAKYWLCASELSIKEIASKLNFDTSGHFSRFFKHFSGQNPTEFQRIECSII